MNGSKKKHVDGQPTGRQPSGLNYDRQYVTSVESVIGTWVSRMQICL